MTMIRKIRIKYNLLVFSFFCSVMGNKELDENKFIFESEGDYTDNAKALSDYIILHKKNEKIINYWIVEKKSKYKDNKDEIFIKKYSWNPINIYKKSKIFSTSKYVFFTHPWYYYKKNKNQVVINLWHGTTFKNTTGSIGKTYDYMICPSENVADWQSRFTDTPKNKLVYCGYPRNDLFFSRNDNLCKIVDKKDNSLIICMPTYHQTKNRNDSDKINPFVIPYINTLEDLNDLNDYLIKNKCILVIKPHHLQIMNFVDSINCSNILFIKDEDLISNNIQLYELLSITDALITDVSSVYFDYLLLDKPIGFYIEEIEAYEKKRGYMIDNYTDYMPGEKIKTQKDFFEFISNINNHNDGYKNQRKELCSYVNKYKYNHCERLLKLFNIKI